MDGFSLENVRHFNAVVLVDLTVFVVVLAYKAVGLNGADLGALDAFLRAQCGVLPFCSVWNFSQFVLRTLYHLLSKKTIKIPHNG